MKKYKSYLYRIYPTKKQEGLLSKHFGASRWVYNWGLSKKIEVYQQTKKSISCFDLMKLVTELKKEEKTKWLSEVNSQSLQASLVNLDKAFTRFFKTKEGFPNFKNKYTSKVCQFPQFSEVLFFENKIKISKFREGIKCKFSRTFEGTIKTVTVRKTATNKYFASILVEEEVVEPIKKPIEIESAVGLDLGLKTFLVASNGLKVENPKFLKNSLLTLKREQRKLAKKQKGSKNSEKQRLKVAKVHEKITNQRNDFLHKVSTQLVSDEEINTFCLETLNISGMVKNHKLARAISDAGWATLVQFIEYKAEWAGKNVLRIGQFEPSSKICNTCGKINKDLTLSDRTWTCSCGSVLDRDENAAKNIRDIVFSKL